MITTYFKNLIELQSKIVKDSSFLNELENIIEVIKKCYKNGGKILIAGNGGSAADAQHFAAEVVVRYEKERKGYPAIALTTDTSVITACGNDFDFSAIFARQIQSLGKEGDVFIAISTSGNSANIISALKECKNKAITTVSLLGKDGGEAKKESEYSIVVQSNKISHIQEIHSIIIHVICEALDKTLE